MPIQSKQQPPYYSPGDNSQTKQLIALVTQTSTNAPVLTILKNTYNKTITSNRDTTGSYYLQSNGEFTVGKTTVVITEGAAIDPLTIAQAFSNNLNANYVFINTFYNGAASDGQMTDATLIITTYQ